MISFYTEGLPDSIGYVVAVIYILCIVISLYFLFKKKK